MSPPDKSTLRTRLLAARRAVGTDEHAAEAEAVRRQLGVLAVDGVTVCAYVPVGGEPGSPAMLDDLRDRGARVLLPVVTVVDGVRQPLRWGEYRPGRLVTARFGLLEPPEPWLPAAAVAESALLIVPALAVDRRGMRLGRGAGFYDRTLVLTRPDAQLIALVRDSELVEELPADPHDVPMTHALTPRGGLVELARSAPPGMSPTG